jgi:hypothetical protein
MGELATVARIVPLEAADPVRAVRSLEAVNTAEVVEAECALVLPMADLDSERWTQTRFNARFVPAIGAIGLQETVQAPEAIPAEPPATTLAEAINHLAAGDDLEASQLVEANIGSAASEGVFKRRHITTIQRTTNEQGEVVQWGTTAHDISMGAMVHRPNRPEALKQFTLAEALNSYREEDALRAGLLEDHYLLVASCVPDGLPEEQIDYRGDGYFTKSVTYCLQATTHQGGNIMTQSAFDAGTDAPEDASYEDRMAQRFDLPAIGLVYEWLGQEAPTTALEFLQNPLLISKDLMPNGVLDFWRLVDMAADQLRGVTVDRPIEHYLARVSESQEREASLGDTRQAIKQELLAHAGTFADPIDAVQLLWELVKKHAVMAAGLNTHIDPSVFGEQARKGIELARKAAGAGDYAQMTALLVLAERVAVITGCGGGAGSSEQQKDGETPDASESDEEARIPSNIRCLKCRKESPKDKVIGADEWHCPHCKYAVDICTGEERHASEPEPPKRFVEQLAALLLTNISSFGTINARHAVRR